MATGRGLRGARVQAGRADGRAGRRASRRPKSSQNRVVITKIDSGNTTHKSGHNERMDHNVRQVFHMLITRLEKNI